MTERTWPPYREPLRGTIVRTGLIALIGGAILSQFWGGFSRWPLWTLLILWPSFGGHWVEFWFLNWLRPRLSPARAAQIAARLAVWFVAGIGLAIAMVLTAAALAGFHTAHWPHWYIGGLAFIAVELLAHFVMLLGGHPNFYNGRG